jgi:hypothetical protein
MLLNLIVWLMSGFLALVFVIFTNSILKFHRNGFYLIAAYIGLHAHFVIIGQILSFIGMLNNRESYLLVQVIAVIIVAGIWWLCQCPELLPVQWQRQIKFPHRSAILATIKQQPLFALLVMTVALLVVLTIVYTLFLPEMVDDVLTTYMPRMAMWYQDGMIQQMDLPAHYFPITTYPITSLMPMYWVFLFSPNPNWISLISWISMPIASLSIFLLARHLGASSRTSLFASLLWLLSPNVVRLSATGQQDFAFTA